ncbi:MAG: hypothetical protein E7486_04735, partial [Ruminococcaceae bacterium]|nr:hypothetical protein [Oscillospiraceae bacterium]
MKKILACVLAAAIASTAIIFSVSATTETTVIQNFDGTSATITEVTGSNTTLVNVANPDKSSQLVVRDAGHSWFHQAVPADAQDWSGMTGLSFYVDASRASQGLQYLDLQFYDANGGSARIVNEGAVGYLVLDDGTKMGATFNTYRLFNFPANFKGTIEIPLTSIAASVDLSKITTIEAAFGTATGDVYYFDDFRLYKEENGKVITKTIENFDAATAPISCSSCVSSLVVDTPADKALQAVTKFGGHTYFNIPVPAEKKDWSKSDALVFYVELPDRDDIYMDIAFNDNDTYHRLAEGSAVAWFISEDGTVTDANFGGSYRMWTLPANFKGEFVIPLTSIDSAIDLTQMTNIEVAFGVAAGETYIFDDFRLVTSTGDKNIIAGYNDIAPSVPKASTAGVNDAISVWDGNGYKITAAGAGHTYFTLPVPEAAKDWTGKTSVSFYVDGSANGIQYFDIAFIDAANGKAGIVNEGAVGYLTPDGG